MDGPPLQLSSKVLVGMEDKTDTLQEQVGKKIVRLKVRLSGMVRWLSHKNADLRGLLFGEFGVVLVEMKGV